MSEKLDLPTEKDIGAVLGKRARQEEGWQPIETAPKDGRIILISTGQQWVTAARWADNFSSIHYRDASPGWYCPELDNRVEPICWMPLPPPPNANEAA